MPERFSCALTNERDFPGPHGPRVAATGNECHDGKVRRSHQLFEKGKSMAIVTVGIDLAKNVFAIHGVDVAGKPPFCAPACRGPGYWS